MKESVGLRAKTYAYLMDDDSEHKKAKGTKKCIIKRRLMFKNYKDCLFNDKMILQLQQRFKSDYRNIYTEQINNIALSSNNDKRLQAFDKTTTYSYKTNVFKVCESEMLKKYKLLVLMIMQMKTKQHNLKRRYITDHPYRSTLIIPKLLLSIQMISKMLTKILRNAIQIMNIKY